MNDTIFKNVQIYKKKIDWMEKRKEKKKEKKDDEAKKIKSQLDEKNAELEKL